MVRVRVRVSIYFTVYIVFLWCQLPFLV
jgi:hypothetical protein